MACSSWSSFSPCSSPSLFSSCLHPKSFSGCFFPQCTDVRNRSLGLHLRLLQHRTPSISKILCLRGSKATTVVYSSWDRLVLKSEGLVLVEFYASWCGPCQMVHRVMDEIAEEYKGKVQCLLLNTDENPDVAEEYDIKVVPVVLIFKNGSKQGSVAGTMPREFYVAAIEEVLAS